MGVSHRVVQFARALRPGRDGELPVEATELLTERERELFSRMTSYDKVHAVRVFERLRALRPDDGPLLAAALLHDVGKGLPGLHHRVGLVVTERFWAGDLSRWSTMPPRSFRGALWGLWNHAEVGARFLEAAGSDRRIVEIVRAQRSAAGGEAALLAQVDSEC